MKRTRVLKGLAVISLLCMLLSGCKASPATETIVIPGTDEIYTGQQGTQPFQVKRIYRIPDQLLHADQWLGWSGSDSILAAFKTRVSSEQMVLQRLAYPYEQSREIGGLQLDGPQIRMSPDGRYIFHTSTTSSKLTLKVTSLPDGKDVHTKEINPNEKFLQAVSWSGNSMYLGCLLVSPFGDEASLVVFDQSAQTFKTYQLRDVPRKATLLNLNISDDGAGVLLTSLYYRERSNPLYMMLGTVDGEELKAEYNHDIGGEQNTWITNDQIAFLGTGGDLLLYDRRNHELSVMLEKVSSFTISNDKKSIAYTLNNEDVLYAGKIQGKNVLYNEPVYHGIVPAQMEWSPDNTSLFLHGGRQFTDSLSAAADSKTGQTFILTFQ